MAHHPATLDVARFALLERLVVRLALDGQVVDDVRRAVDVLTASADPDRAHRLALCPGEPPALVERLAAWALRHATEEALAEAAWMLDADGGPRHSPVALDRLVTG